MIQLDPNGGDMGRAAIKPLSPIEFSLVVPHVANILEDLYRLTNATKHYFYAFEFTVDARKGMEIVMMSIRLPDHVYWYEVDGMKMFAIRGASGGITTGYICYLVTNYKDA